MEEKEITEKIDIYYQRVSLMDMKPENQMVALSEDINRRGLNKEFVRVFTDKASGTTTSRPEFNKAMDLVAEGKVRSFTVWKLDRLFRDTKHALLILELFKQYEVQFRSLTESFDTGTSMGKLLFTIMAGFAEFERSLIAERTRLAMYRLKAEGKKLGRPKGSVDKKKQSFHNRSRATKEMWAKKKELTNAKGLLFANT